MDYFAYNSKSIQNAVDNSLEGWKSPSALLPATPTIYAHEGEKTPNRPTFIRYSSSCFISDAEGDSSNQSVISPSEELSPPIPSPPITPECVSITPSLSLPTNKRRYSNPPPVTHSPRLHVLIVDDNTVNLQILSRLLTVHMADMIAHIELVKSGVKALAVLACRRFDLILMDIDMPILNGIETTRHIRSSSDFDIIAHNRSIPIVAVTTNDSDEWRQLYTDIGMDGCISKPISPKELKKSLSTILDIHLPPAPYTPE
ncbi:CheY-like superfamily [Pilobolus umbonatus]|nr:CheY-like superfamily [Pilobolus umbonatus]